MSQNINDQSSPTVSLRTVGIELPLIATEPLTSGPVAINPEFPGFANIFESTGEAEIHSPTPNRREFIALSSAAITLAAVGCRRPDLEILPYSQTPDNIIPGIPLYYASAMPRPGGCAALLIETDLALRGQVFNREAEGVAVVGGDAEVFGKGVNGRRLIRFVLEVVEESSFVLQRHVNFQCGGTCPRVLLVSNCNRF